MGQSLPIEASETLAFTPEALLALRDKGKIDAVPVFTLRAVTLRDRRFRDELRAELRVTLYSEDELRAKMLEILHREEFWGPEKVAEFSPKLEAYWQALDDHALQAKDDPDLVFDHDPDVVAAAEQLERDLWEMDRGFGRMIAANARARHLNTELLLAVVIKRFSGLDIDPEIDRGYLDPDSIPALGEALAKLEGVHGIAPGTLVADLFIACAKRWSLDEEEAGNSESPSPSENTPESSTTGDEATAGTSKASGTSTKTRKAGSSNGIGT